MCLLAFYAERSKPVQFDIPWYRRGLSAVGIRRESAIPDTLSPPKTHCGLKPKILSPERATPNPKPLNPKQ